MPYIDVTQPRASPHPEPPSHLPPPRGFSSESRQKPPPYPSPEALTRDSLAPGPSSLPQWMEAPAFLKVLPWGIQNLESVGLLILGHVDCPT